MSPSLQKLRKDLDQAKAHSKQSASDLAAGRAVSVGYDVVEMLFSAFTAQDIEIRKLKAERNATDTVSDTSKHISDDSIAAEARADAYVGHTTANVNSPVYSMKNLKQPHA